MSCGCTNCKDPYTLPLGPIGGQGIPGGKGNPGTPGVCLAANDGMVHYRFGPQEAPAGTATDFEFTNLTYPMPLNMLETDGDTIIVRAAFERITTAFKLIGDEGFGIFVGDQRVTYDLGGAIPLGLVKKSYTADVTVVITRTSGTEFTATSTITIFGEPIPNVGSALYAGYSHPEFYLRQNSTTSFDLAGTSYDIKGLATYSGTTTPLTMLHMTVQKISKV
tara:strand:+ start:1333 stop:1995 length:663 start_codon:yes stop_codon:yes gene_type:complete